MECTRASSAGNHLAEQHLNRGQLILESELEAPD